MSIYYIYAYLREDGTPYYIGKGKGNRAFAKNNKDRKSIPKDKSKIIIMENNLTEIGAFALERFYIRWYGRKDDQTGILRNLTDGGEGASGRKWSDLEREKRKAITRMPRRPYKIIKKRTISERQKQIRLLRNEMALLEKRIDFLLSIC